jgi:hypothetical protein
MTTHELAIAKIQKLPESLAQEVADFVDFLLVKSDTSRWESWNEFLEARGLAESDLPDYLANLVDYEERLARGEIQW